MHSHRQACFIENVDKNTKNNQVDRLVSSCSIAQRLKIDHKTVLSHLRKVEFKNKLHVLQATTINTIKTGWIEFPSAKPWSNGKKSTISLTDDNWG
ncbi:hypothetical protein TNCV_2815471 [Trichonephila clavipes]|nr:hypothetical protein TNCV_2815471 [Trichonephila clavipes]